MAFAWKAAGITYNRYLAVAARVVRRSLKEDKRLAAERRGEMSEMRFAKWEGGKQGDHKDLETANAKALAENAGQQSQ
ncbi:F-type H+-transporting ATPase subunit epsilon [Neohortaea acidophila]|uniref:F-type H+-transporting ATPase subunit epsilon n=1 Tax=Neohortaea acidophila TaxID=245834 RepID=A0A6A6PGP1_9PEZI|nr:F-type H+-transporting ATPase subunit epsilon [Neohortaea acidophila]KAF2478793.1 F-type H+-transporting ATPase subunit epsilon [Neohortaea acidophila]